MGLTRDDRIRALMDFRYTERQARFLELVMRHAGVCVPRQYARFAGIAHGGARSNAFFSKLVRCGHAAVGACLHNRAHVYHVHSKRLYYAIGEPNSRYRRSVPPRLAIERLMWLDAVLATPDLHWLTTNAEKAALFASLMPPTRAQSAPDDQLGGATARPLFDFSDTPPIGLDASGRAVFLYLATVPWTEEFRRFLHRHITLLQVTPVWTLRLVFPRPIDQHYDSYQSVIREELETPLQPATIRELKAHFERRRTAGERRANTFAEILLDARTRSFERTRFSSLYRRWLKDGDTALEAVSSTVTAEALASGNGREECLVLPHTYRHLFALVASSDGTPDTVEKRLRRPNSGGNRPPHVLNREAQPGPPDPELSVSEQMARDWHRLNDWYNAQKTQGLTP